MIWNVTEYAATIIEYLIYADFMIKFLKPKSKNKWFCYIVISFFNIALTLMLNKFLPFEGFLGVIRISSNFVMAYLLLKGSLFEKLFSSLITDTSVILINFITLNLLSGIFEKSISELITERSMLRLFILFITKFIFFIFTRLMLKIKEKDNYTFNAAEWITISVIFFITMAVEIELFLMNIKYNLSMKSPLTISMGTGLILINIFVYVLMIKISRKNNEKTALLIDKMQLETYRAQLAESESRYNEINKIHHDMKNHLQCIQGYLTENDAANAQNYINDILQNKLDFNTTFIKTNNRVIDIVSNIKLIQCQYAKIKTKLNIQSFTLEIDDVDMCIILGNLFDNAIEACKKTQTERLICFEITQRKGYVNILIKNTVEESVLESNPELQTTKQDKKNHGIGLKSVKETIEKYNGMIEFYENNNFFIADIWLPGKKIC